MPTRKKSSAEKTSAVRKVVVTDYIESDLEWEKGVLEDRGIELDAFQLKGQPENEVYEKVKDADVIVVNMVRMPATLIDRLDNCKVIIRHGIGYDNVDVDACTRNNIQFANQPDYCTTDVAEHAISLIMASARKLFIARDTLENSSRRGEWDFSGLFPIRRMEGKVVGIIGLGRIGLQVARKLQSFGFRLIAADPYVDDSEFEKAGVERTDLDTLLARADFITIHTPLNPDTRSLVNRETLAKMKETAYVINTARGPIVDAGALAEALESKDIGGAAIDVYDDEPPSQAYPLFHHSNVILTPHSGWASVESAWAIREKIVGDILSIAEGGNPANMINDVKFSKTGLT